MPMLFGSPSRASSTSHKGVEQHAGTRAEDSAYACCNVPVKLTVSDTTYLAALSVPINRHISIPTTPLGSQPLTPHSLHAWMQGVRPKAWA